MPVSNTITSYYYRAQFNMPSDPMGARLQFQIWADDGIVMYINGTEVRSVNNDANNPNGRYYMTNGTETIRMTTCAQSHQAGAASIREVNYPLNLVANANTLAVSVHQDRADTTNTVLQDHAFSMQILATLPPLGRPLKPGLVSQPQSISTNVGANVTITANAEGTLPFVGRWYFGTNATPVSTVNVPSGTAITNIPNLLALPRNNVQAANEGAYTLVVSNAQGMATSSVATLTVLRPPTFLAQPTNVTVAVGGTAVFSAPAEGTSPLRYQWYFNGTSGLYGETNATLTLLNVQAEQAGAYNVVAYNSVATNTSSAATLVVFGGQATKPTIPPGGATYSGAGGNFTVQVLTETGHNYSLVYSTNVENTAAWTLISASTVAGNGAVRTLTDVNPTNQRRFYRIKVD
jgi:hypothetical protein